MAQKTDKTKKAEKDSVKFKKGMPVRVNTYHYKGKATITKLVPQGASTGDARLTVKMEDGTTRRPYPSQCRLVADKAPVATA